MPKRLHKDPYLIKKWRGWKYKNTILLLISIGLLIYLIDTPVVKDVIEHIGRMGYVGAFVVGIFFVSTFTVAPASVVLFHLGDKLDPFGVAIIAGLGAMTGDFLIFRFLKDGVFNELAPLFKRLEIKKVRSIFKSPYFAWTLPVLGAFIIASPIPDEAGVSILGLSKIKKWQFFLVTFLLNAFGIFLVVTASRL